MGAFVGEYDGNLVGGGGGTGGSNGDGFGVVMAGTFVVVVGDLVGLGVVIGDGGTGGFVGTDTATGERVGTGVGLYVVVTIGAGVG